MTDRKKTKRDETIVVPTKRLMEVLSEVLAPHVAMAILEELRGPIPEPPRWPKPTEEVLERARMYLRRAGVDADTLERRKPR